MTRGAEAESALVVSIARNMPLEPRREKGYGSGVANGVPKVIRGVDFEDGIKQIQVAA